MLNDTKVKNLKPKDKNYLLADSNGLSIEINKSGAKYWRYRYRFNGKAQVISLGKYPIVGLAKARQERDFYKGLLLDNINPAQYKKEQKAHLKQQAEQEKTFAVFFNEWLAVNTDSWSDNYQKEIIKRANKHLLPYIGKTKIGSIKPKTMLGVLKRIEQKGLIETLQKVKGIASQVFRYCVGIGTIDFDPTRDLPRNIFKKKIVSNYATITEPKKIGRLLNNINNYYGSFQITQALRLAPFVFLRPSELSSLKWAYVDFDNEQIKLPAKVMKMKTPHIVPLVKQTIQILQECRNVDMQSPYIFPSNKSPKTRHITPESLRSALRTMGYSNDEITTHGFRAMASTLLHEQGFNSDFIEKQLAHQERNKIKGAYNHAEYLIERRNMMKQWADYLEHLKNNQAGEN